MTVTSILTASIAKRALTHGCIITADTSTGFYMSNMRF